MKKNTSRIFLGLTLAILLIAVAQFASVYAIPGLSSSGSAKADDYMACQANLNNYGSNGGQDGGDDDNSACYGFIETIDATCESSADAAALSRECGDYGVTACTARCICSNPSCSSVEWLVVECESGECAAGHLACESVNQCRIV